MARSSYWKKRREREDSDPILAYEAELVREEKRMERKFEKWKNKQFAEVRAMPMPLTEAFFAKNPPEQ